LTHAVLNGARAVFQVSPWARWRRFELAAVTAALYFLQPAARLYGRLWHGLTPWRRRGSGQFRLPLPQALDIWSESNWRGAEQRLAEYEQRLRAAGAAVMRGGEYDRWDLAVRGGLLGSARLLMVIEEHGQGRQFLRIRLWPEAIPTVMILAALFAVLGGVAATDLEWAAWALLNITALVLVGRTLYECASAMSIIRQVIGMEAGAALAKVQPESRDTDAVQAVGEEAPNPVKTGRLDPLNEQLAAE